MIVKSYHFNDIMMYTIMTKSDIQKLTEDIINFRDARDWKQFHNPKDCTLSLVLEAEDADNKNN
jgi:hypothetical protein